MNCDGVWIAEQLSNLRCAQWPFDCAFLVVRNASNLLSSPGTGRALLVIGAVSQSHLLVFDLYRIL